MGNSGRYQALLLLGCYRLVYRLFFPFWIMVRAVLRLAGKKPPFTVWQRAGFRLQAEPGRVWFFAVSAGEAAGAAVLAQRLAQDGSASYISTVTAAGLNAARTKLPQQCVLPEPFDMRRTVNRWFRKLKPAAVVLYEMELWPELLLAASRFAVPVVLVNGRMPQRDYRRYRYAAPLLRLISEPVVFAGVRSRREAARFRAAGFAADRIRQCRDIKYDQAAGRGRDLNLPAYHLVVLSAHCSEEEQLLEVLVRLSAAIPGFRAVYAPRTITDRKRISRRLTKRGFAAELRSNSSSLVQCSFFSQISHHPSVLVLDTIGELHSVCAAAQTALLGGSFDKRIGGHNPLEAAVWGVPVVFGPAMENFLPQREALLQGGGYQAADGAAAAEVLLRWLSDEALRREAGQGAAAVVAAGRGGVEQYAEIILSLTG